MKMQLSTPPPPQCMGHIRMLISHALSTDIDVIGWLVDRGIATIGMLSTITSVAKFHPQRIMEQHAS